MIRFANAVESAGLVISRTKLVRRALQTEHDDLSCYDPVASELRSKMNHVCEVRQDRTRNQQIYRIMSNAAFFIQATTQRTPTHPEIAFRRDRESQSPQHHSICLVAV